MKIKKVFIRKGGLEDFYRHVEKNLKGPIKGTGEVEIFFEDVNTFKKFLTEERMKILSAIRHKKPKSVYALAKMLHRDRSNVITDLTILRNMGFIEFSPEEGVRNTVRPIADYDKIEIVIEI